MSIQFGLRGHDLLGATEFLTLVDGLKEYEINSIQLAFGKAISDIDFTTGNFSPGLASYIGNTLKENGIEVPVLGCYINTVHPEEDQLEANIKKFKEHLLYAKFLGAHMVGTETCTPHPENKKVPETRTEANYQKFLSTMKILVAEAEKLGVTIGVEGVNKETLYSPELVRRFLDDINSPNVVIIYDIVNLLSVDEVDDINGFITKCFDLFGEKIGCIHIKDFVIGKNDDGDLDKIPTPIGEGLMNFEFLINIIKERKPYIHALLEESNKDRCKNDLEFLETIGNKN